MQFSLDLRVRADSDVPPIRKVEILQIAWKNLISCLSSKMMSSIIAKLTRLHFAISVVKEPSRQTCLSLLVSEERDLK